jgi:hypothetical protein
MKPPKSTKLDDSPTKIKNLTNHNEEKLTSKQQQWSLSKIHGKKKIIIMLTS